MTTSPVAAASRATLLDRIVHWALDLDGDLYGDERERLRWYEGITTAASLQWLAVPWAAAVLVWILGRTAVLPLAVVMAAMYVPMLICLGYMHRRRVDTAIRNWTPKAVVLSAVGVPYAVFVIGCITAVADMDRSMVTGMSAGAAVGIVLANVALVLGTRRRRRRESSAVADVD